MGGTILALPCMPALRAWGQIYFTILILSSHRRPGLSGFCPSGFFFTPKLHAFLFCTTRATSPAHIILLDSITAVIFSDN
jgi:hypothetical protein